MPLFTYDAILVAGTMSLARLRAWPLLNLASYVLTTVTVAGWLESSFVPAEYLTTQGFLTLFTAMFLYILGENRRSQGDAAQMATLALASAPFLYYVASLQVLFERAVPLLVFLLGITAAGLAWLGPGAAAWKRLVLWAAAMIPLASWVAEYGPTLPLWIGLAGLVSVCGMHVLAQLAPAPVPLTDRWELALVHGNGLALLAGGSALAGASAGLDPGVVALAVAAWHGLLAWWTWRRVQPAAVHWIALAAVALAAALAELVDAAWWPIGLAAEGTALVWISRRERRGWLAVAGTVFLAASLAAYGASLFADVPVGYRVLLNRRVAVGIAVVSLLVRTGRILARAPRMAAPGWLTAPGTWIVTANVVTLAVATHEIQAFWELRDAGRTGYLARHVMFSSAWGLYGVGLIVAGIRQRSAPLRYLAIALLGLTSLKVFLVDLSALDRIYRILSIVVLGILLLVASYLYQRHLGSGTGRTPPAAEEVP